MKLARFVTSTGGCLCALALSANWGQCFVSGSDLRGDAISALGRGDYVSAEVLYRKLLATSPRNLEYLDGLATAAHFEGQSSEVLAVLKQRLEIKIAPRALSLAAANYCRLGEYDQARETLERLRRFPPELSLLSLVAPCSLSAAGPLDSVAIYQQLVDGEQEPRDEFAVGLARSYIQASGRLLTKLRRLPGSDSYVAAVEAAQAGAASDARGAFPEALSKVPAINSDSTPPQLQEILRRNPAAAAVHYVIGVICGERGMQAFMRAKNSFPSSPQPALFEADMYASTGQYDRAVNAYKAVIRDFPDAQGIHFQLAGLYRSRKDYEPALAEYKQQERATPKDERVSEGISGCLRELRKYEEIYTLLRPVVAQTSCPEWALVDFGMAAMRHDRPDEALAAFERAKRLNPNNKTTRYNLYVLYKDLQQSLKAAAEKQAFERISNAEAKFALARKP